MLFVNEFVYLCAWNFLIMAKQKTHEKPKSKKSLSLTGELVLHNDDFNTFDFVIKSLVEICNHEPEQAEQCAMIVHYKGKCSIVTGPIAELEPMVKELNNRGLTANIE